jgi:hypothetical protein
MVLYSDYSNQYYGVFVIKMDHLSDRLNDLSIIF